MQVCVVVHGYVYRPAGVRVQDWHGEIKEDMKKAFVKIVEDIQAHVKQLAISERAMLLLVCAIQTLGCCGSLMHTVMHSSRQCTCGMTG